MYPIAKCSRYFHLPLNDNCHLTVDKSYCPFLGGLNNIYLNLFISILKHQLLYMKVDGSVPSVFETNQWALEKDFPCQVKGAF